MARSSPVWSPGVLSCSLAVFFVNISNDRLDLIDTSIVSVYYFISVG